MRFCYLNYFYFYHWHVSLFGHSHFIGAPELGTGRENKSGKTVMDKKFLEKIEAVRRYWIIIHATLIETIDPFVLGLCLSRGLVMLLMETLWASCSIHEIWGLDMVPNQKIHSLFNLCVKKYKKCMCSVFSWPQQICPVCC
jgi:hypothetical protein